MSAFPLTHLITPLVGIGFLIFGFCLLFSEKWKPALNIAATNTWRLAVLILLLLINK